MGILLDSNDTFSPSATRIVRAVVQGTAGKNGAEYFPALVKVLAEALGFRVSFITECLGQNRVATLGFWNGEQLDRYEYPLEGTPCEDVIEGKICTHDQNLQALFPDDQDLVLLEAESYAGIPLRATDGRILGHLVVIDDQPFEEQRPDLALLQIFATQASAELERMRATTELAREQRRYRQFFESDLSGAFILNADGQILHCNAAFARMFGFKSPEELQSSAWSSAFAVDDHESFVARLKRKLHIEGLERTYRRLDGTTVYTVENVIAHLDAQGEVEEIHGHVLDLTRLRRLEKKMLQSQKLEIVGQLAGGIAHDFNNLLTSILGYGDLLLRQLPENEPPHRSCEEIVNAARRAAELTRQLLAFSRRQIVQPRKLDLNRTLDKTTQLLRRLVRDQATLDLEASMTPTPVFIDPGQLEQIVVLLVVNAREALPGGGEITIRTGVLEVTEGMIEDLSPGSYCWLEVGDNGVGIPTEIQDRVFEPFFSTKESSGLGLSTVYGIVKQNAGTLRLESKPAHGTRVTLYFPRAVDTFAPDLPPRAPKRSPKQDHTVLVAEDQDLVRQLVRQVLESYGYRVIDAANAPEARKRATEHTGTIDLLITDVVMPGESGRELAETMLAERPDLRVIYMSGHTDEILLRHGIRQGNLSFLQKPFSEKKLIALVREVLV